MSKRSVFLAIVLAYSLLMACKAVETAGGLVTSSDLPTAATTASFAPVLTLRLPTSTAAASATATITRTATPTLRPSAIFSLDSANSTAPEDVLKVVYYSAQGGGGGYVCPSDTELAFAPLPHDQELGYATHLSVCNWKPGERVQLTLQKPDGSVEIFDLVGDSAGASFDYITSITDPAGKYTYTLTGESGSIQASNYFVLPVEPQLYFLEQKTIFLHGFKPGERVRLVAFAGPGFDSWQEFTLDERGESLIRVSEDVSGWVYIAVGEYSGEIILRPPFSPYVVGGYMRSILSDIQLPTWPLEAAVQDDQGHTLCPDAPPSRVMAGIRARVTYNQYSSLWTREGPGQAFERAVKLMNGDEFDIIGGPECADGFTWWQISSKGWVAEGDKRQYYIEPGRNRVGCPDAPATDLRPGIHAITRGDGTVLREAPGELAAGIMQLPRGRGMTILDGPQCKDGAAWWHVQLFDGTTGWVPEAASFNDYAIWPYRYEPVH